MGKGAKIAIGCAAVFLLVVIGICVLLFSGAWFAKRKLGELAEPLQRLQKYEKKANATPFQTPADNTFREDRLKVFLEIRKKVYEFMSLHHEEFDALSKKKEADFGSLTKGLGLVGEAHMTREKAQAEFGMSDGEYLYMVATVYRSMIAANYARDHQGRQMGEDAAQSSAEAVKKQEKQLQDSPSGPESEAQKSMREGLKKIQEGASQMQQGIDVPAQNIALVEKYRADIEKYAMKDLALFGL